MDVQQLDIETAYLIVEFEESIYMKIPDLLLESLVEIKKSDNRLIRKTQKWWNKLVTKTKCVNFRNHCMDRNSLVDSGVKITSMLLKLNFHSTDADSCVYMRGKANSDKIIMEVLVNDFIMLSKNKKLLQGTKIKLLE